MAAVPRTCCSCSRDALSCHPRAFVHALLVLVRFGFHPQADYFTESSAMWLSDKERADAMKADAQRRDERHNARTKVSLPHGVPVLMRTDTAPPLLGFWALMPMPMLMPMLKALLWVVAVKVSVCRGHCR